MDDEVAASMRATTTGATALRLGRRTYEAFARVWPSASEDDPAVAAMDRVPKHVASRSPEALGPLPWAGSSVLGADLEREVRALRAQGSGEIAVFGSIDLVRTLAALGLVDEYRLLVFPLVLGTGERLFGRAADPTPLALLSSTATSSGVLVTSYAPVGRTV